MVSYYPAIHGLDIAVGDRKIQPKSVLHAMGRELSTVETVACFQCRSTRGVVEGRLELKSFIPGVQCEHVTREQLSMPNLLPPENPWLHPKASAAYPRSSCRISAGSVISVGHRSCASAGSASSTSGFSLTGSPTVNATTGRTRASGCLACHMPKAPLSGGHQISDRNIRVVRAGEPFPE